MVFVILVITELSALNQNIPRVDGFTSALALIVSLSSISYCKKQLLIVLLIMSAYVVVRAYFWVGLGYENARFTSYLVISLGFIYFFARQQSARDRKMFQ